MNCILLFHFILLLISITLFILSISTSKWIVYDNGTTTGIMMICQRLNRQDNTDRYSLIHNSIRNDDVYICFNHLFKWYNASINGPKLLSKLNNI